MLNLTDNGEGTCGYGYNHTYETRKRLKERDDLPKYVKEAMLKMYSTMLE